MKICSKEALLLGGVYTAIGFAFSFFDSELSENLAALLLGIFVICLVMLCMNKTPKFLSGLMKKWPRVSYYLASFGWLPYFFIIGLPALILIAWILKLSDDAMAIVAQLFVSVISVSIPASLAIAFVLDMMKKYAAKKSRQG